MRRTLGLTMLELLCCLVVVAVLAACAVPTHRQAAVRTRRTDARVALMHLASLQERHFFLQGRYAASLEELGEGALARSGEGFYRLQVESRASGQGYLARAWPDAGGPQREDRECTALSVDESGRRSAMGSADADWRCWN